ncbi:hypothetical protein LR021_00090 [Candidatus Bipolaricaulota bacterium]|nr:hypothetical protein [Candidatus Bipolaricaulota bacterium]
MKWMVLVGTLLILFAFSGEGMANETPFDGSIELKTTFRPDPLGPPHDVQIELDLAFSIAGFALESSTLFDLDGFKRQIFTTAIDLGLAVISNEITFQRPGRFTKNHLAVDVSIIDIDFGIDLILADIAFPQTPHFNIGMVIDIRGKLPAGFSIISLTGFGVENLAQMIDDSKALCRHSKPCTDIVQGKALCRHKPVTVVAGFAFEEQLTKISIDHLGIRAAAITTFDIAGLKAASLKFGYYHADPLAELALSFMMRTDFGRDFALTGMKFELGSVIAGINFSSRTEFASHPSPMAPLAFDRQTFSITGSIAKTEITSKTVFTAPFTFYLQRITIVTEIEPVKFMTQTTFDTTGFAAMKIEVGVTISGIRLYTSTAFDFHGITEVVAGFQLTF